MPESPDFDQTATRIGEMVPAVTRDLITREVAEQLRLIWNARGAADALQLDPLIADWTWKDKGWHRHNGHCGVYLACAKELTEVNRALRSLDR